MAADRLRVELNDSRLLLEKYMENLDAYNQAVKDLTDKVAALTTVEQSAIALIQGLRARINQLITSNDGLVPTAELQKLSASLDAGTRALADAVAANTADPAPTVAPPETTTAQPANPEAVDPAPQSPPPADPATPQSTPPATDAGAPSDGSAGA
jgi:hypothetical protein